MTSPGDRMPRHVGGPRALRPLTLALTALLALGACTADAPVTSPDVAALTPASTDGRDDTGGPAHGRIRYGASMRVGNGHARSYVLVDAHRGHTVEVGVAMDEHALDGLPAADPGGGESSAEYPLALPDHHGTPFNFAVVGWNPAGHAPPGVYDSPHFDFHFYTISQAARNAILPSDPQYGAKAGNFPAATHRFPFYVDPVTASGGAPPGAVAVPRMGMHWLDVRSPELQNRLGNPAGYRPFTKTFIYGSWDGSFIFAEPMITRSYILAKRTATDAAVRDEVIPVPTAAHYAPAGLYPSAYRIAWNGSAGEYRIALTRLSYR